MNLERRDLSFTNKPEFNSPFFSYKVLNPSKIGEIVNFLNRKNSAFSLQVGQDTNSVVGPAEINSWGDNKFLELSLALRLPSKDYLPNFISDPGVLSASGRRGIRLQRQLRRHVDRDLTLFYGHEVEKVKGDTIIRKVAKLPNADNSEYVYYLPTEVFRDRSQANGLMIKKYLEDGLKTLIIFSTMLYQHHGVIDKLRELVIDPSLFKLTYERKRPMSLQEIAELEKHGPEIIARAVLGVDKPDEKVVSNEDNDKARLEKDVDNRRN